MLLWKRTAAIGAAMSLPAAARPALASASADAGATIRPAKDNVCAIADVAVTTRAERSRRLGSRGALRFDRFRSTMDQMGSDVWKVPFDVKDPVHTSNTLDTGHAAFRKVFTERYCEKDILASPSIEVVQVSSR
ncbi:hypothetical protein [Amycolatopsis sp. cmx-11-32]|uniref:hypothetical protein n=1 Tax=Amycolatopsis sp. cmx-11-32 TaxID=2785796 RepID=UPI0039E6746C